MVAEQRFGFKLPVRYADLVHWTDIIDGAMYQDAQTAVVDESAGDEADHGDRIRPRLRTSYKQLISIALATRPLRQILESPFVATLLPPLLKATLNCPLES